jgi:hypothetical protein
VNFTPTTVNTIKAQIPRYIYIMNLPMRINFDEKDYTYMIITKGISKETLAIDIHLNGTDYQLVRDKNGDWDAVDVTVSDYPGLLKAIGRNIKLRYRL